MDGRTFRYHDNHEFFRSPTAVEQREKFAFGCPNANGGPQTAQNRRAAFFSPSRPLPWRASPPLHTAGEIASELGYSVSFTFWRSKKAMYPNEA